MNMKDKDMDEIIAIVGDLESVDQPKRMLFGVEVHDSIKDEDALLQKLEQAMSAHYYRTRFPEGTQVREMGISNKYGEFDIWEIIHVRGCSLATEFAEHFIRTITNIADTFGFNVELTKK